jgi:hypothetical protein
MLKIIITALLYFSITVSAIEKPEGNVYCHGKTIIEYRLVNPEKNNTVTDIDLIINGKNNRYLTAYSWFGSNQPTPKNFKFAILGDKQFNPLLVFDDYLEDSNKLKYMKCN